ncbi:MAG: NAD(P)-dependent dehydrogenase (short-subunit alcohol dehydrogenase family) [Parvicellaceae bacterium]|jgi:NAD(P)-dependent dehydrogenase (short-subunit alcohol dehydrogenase family)
MNQFSLTNKKILITGASSGIGRCCAVTFAKAGAELVLSGRNEIALRSLQEEISGATIIVQDLATSEGVDELANQLGQLDGLVHSAGIVKPFPVSFVGEKHIKEVQQINFNAPVELTAKLLRKKKMNANASIVFISSISSSYPYKGGAMYTAFKAALETFSKVVALEYGEKGIRSNCVKAALINTKVLDDTINSLPEEILQAHKDRYLLGFGEPEDVANACQYLLSNASKWVTGTNLVLDGGLTAGA